MKIDRLPAPDDRARHLVDARNLKMARSAHAYVRGSTTRFYEWLETSDSKLPHGPAVWICGDCHLGNLGPLSDAKGRVAVQIRDCDQTVIGNPAHDLVRLGLSLASEARGSNLAGVTTLRIVESLTGGYLAGLEGIASRGRESDWAPKPLRQYLERSVRRRWKHLAAERLDTVRPEIPLGPRFWPVSEDERMSIKALFTDTDVHAAITGMQGKDAADRIEVRDIRYWMKGCSSLGRLRYAVMLHVGDGNDVKPCLIDIKEAVTAAAPRAKDGAMPRSNAERVVTGARALSPHLGERMVAARLGDKGVVLRELMPQDLKFAIEGLTEDEATELASYLAGVVGLAHRRQMTPEQLKSWQSTLSSSRSKTLDAPSWLWTSIVELLGIHESAYLNHCRLYAHRDAA